MMERENGLIEEMLPLLVSNGVGDFTPEQKAAANQFKKFIDHLPGGFLIYRADGNEDIIYANAALIRMFECNSEQEFLEYTGNSFKGIVYREDYEAISKSIVQQITDKDDDLDYVEYRILTKKGNLRYVEDYGHFIKTNVGDIFYVFITDSTEKTEKRQQEHLQRLEVIEGLSVNYDSILYVDLDADSVIPYRMSQKLSKQFDGEMHAKSYNWVIKDFVETWVHPDDQERTLKAISPENIRATLANDPSFIVNFKCIFDNDTQYVQLRIVDVKNNGYISQVVLGSRNISAELKQEMQQKILLENALRESKLAHIAKNTFLSNVSHDMRTPLNALSGYLQLAKKNIDDRESLERSLDKIHDAGKQLLDLVDKVLEISYLESQDFVLKEEPCNLKNITSEVFEEQRPEAKKKSIQMTLEYRNIVHADVFTDKEQLKQVLVNLLSNAIKYTGNGGSIVFAVEETSATSSEYAAFRFSVRDTGIGIAQESLEKIYEPFERESNSTQSGVFGSGLGLTIAKQVIDSMGGTITTESEKGVGSTFTVNLSFKLSGKEADSVSTKDVEDFLKGKKVLLVEDNELNLEIATELLEDLGLIVDSAENGKVAVDKVKNSQPHEYAFVLMDIQMPIMDGWQATEGIRNLPNPILANIPIIALSANAFDSDKRHSAESGMNDHLNKPIDIPALLNSIQHNVLKR